MMQSPSPERKSMLSDTGEFKNETGKLSIQVLDQGEPCSMKSPPLIEGPPSTHPDLAHMIGDQPESSLKRSKRSFKNFLSTKSGRQIDFINPYDPGENSQEYDME